MIVETEDVIANNDYVQDIIEYCPETTNMDGNEVEIEEENVLSEHLMYQCEKCEYIDASIEAVRLHNACAHEGWPLVCPTVELTSIPTPIDNTQIVYVCSLCLRQYTLKEDLRGHMIEYHKCVPIENAMPGEKPKKLEKKNPKIDQMPLKQAVGVGLEEKSPASANVTELRPVPFKDFRIILRSKMLLRCPISYACSYKFENSTKLSIHEKCHLIGSSAEQFKCTECSKEFNSWRHCSTHLWKLHQIDVDLLHCPLCEYKSHASVLVWRHMRVHKKWRPRVLRSLRAVQQRRQQNMQNVSKEKKTIKPTTATVAAAAAAAAAAAPPQLPPPPASNKNKYYAEKICDICGRKFVNGKTLSKHVKTVHNKIKPFICNVCGRKTARKASLIIHMRQHTGVKPLQCKTCKFCTRDPSVLHKHQLRHEKAGKFKCKLCDYICIQTNSYKRHMRINHAEEYKKIACDLCSYVTITEEKLKAHKEDHRKGLIFVHEDSLDATRSGGFKNPRKLHDKNNEISADCFLPLESIDSLPHEPAVDTGGVTIPAPSEDTQFPTYLNN